MRSEAERVRDALRETQGLAAWKTGKLPPDDWPKEVGDLNARKVYSHRANAVIVLSDEGVTETGYYVYFWISSYFPTNDQEWSFEEMAEGVYRYERRRKTAVPAIN